MILWRTIEDHDTLFVLAEISHFAGIGILGYKLQRKRSVAGVFSHTSVMSLSRTCCPLSCRTWQVALHVLASLFGGYALHALVTGVT